jgi:prophage regulatory protein
MGTPELERRTGIPQSTWRHFAATNQGPPSIKVGKRRLYRWPDVESWLAAHQESEAIGS